MRRHELGLDGYLRLGPVKISTLLNRSTSIPKAADYDAVSIWNHMRRSSRFLKSIECHTEYLPGRLETC